MILYRITKPRYADPLDATGASLNGGRFNPPGLPVVYLSETESLARLEALTSVVPGASRERLLHRIHCPESEIETCKALGIALPSGWNAIPPRPATRMLGQKWLRSGASLGLWVPSVVSTQERNVLLNPAHPHFDLLTVDRPTPIHFDPRHMKR